LDLDTLTGFAAEGRAEVVKESRSMPEVQIKLAALWIALVALWWA